MNEYDDLDELLGPLRSAATHAELARENEVVDRMTRVHHSSKGSIMFSSRRARVATLIAAGVLGFGGVAAAGPAVSSLIDSGTTVEEPADDAVPEPVVEEEPVAPEVETVVEEELPEPEALDEQVEDDVVEPAVAEIEVPAVDPDPDTTFDENDCLEGNHGKTVSAVARDDEDHPELADYEVRDAAHSSCGKDVEETESDLEEIDADDTEVESDDEQSEVEETDDEENEPSVRQAKPENTGKPSHAGKSGEGSGHGKKDR